VIILGFKTIKSIYNRLQDDTSKQIFEKRLAYSLSGNFKNIDEMVCSEMKKYGDADIMNRCISWIKENGLCEVSVFGAGFAGYQIVHTLLVNGICVSKVYDNNKARLGNECGGVCIFSPCEISDDEFLILGVNYYREEILNQLESQAVERSHIFIPSRLWWLGDHPQYFDKSIIVPEGKEIFVDGGSLDGGDSKNFVRWCNNKYDRIYAFEPDESNIDKMKMAEKEIRGFEICPVGMWKEKSVLKFSSDVVENCSISENGDVFINVDSIDNVLDGRPATYIKMDIEGSELRALEGAEKTIKAYKSKLAICVYHKPEDIIDIPLKILEINPNYKFYLRHYSYVETETVLYAIEMEVD